MDQYRLLGRSGLRISRLGLGTMTFGTDWGWGANQDESRRIFDAYVDHGGNFIDCANVYTNGTSESWIGSFVHDKRDRLVIATKYAIPTNRRDPNSGGAHRKSMIRSVEGSLRRLKSEYIDVLYLHAWDFTTPVEQILRAMDDLVISGKVLYAGISNTPAWQIAKMQTLADIRALSPLVALQVEYNLIQRTVERELLPAADDLGLGVVAYSPLAEGILSGMYSQLDLMQPAVKDDSSRRSTVLSLGTLSDRSLKIIDVVRNVARELERPMPQVALAWVIQSPSIAAVLVGVRTLDQFMENLRALDLSFSDEQLSRLDRASEIELGYPHDYLIKLMKSEYMGSTMNLL